MNPVFIFLVIFIGVIVWFSINSLFPLIGNIICGLIEETKDIIKKGNEEEEDEN